jgi:hypothetical protein
MSSIGINKKYPFLLDLTEKCIGQSIQLPQEASLEMIIDILQLKIIITIFNVYIDFGQ